ncbi:CC0125/CC1285 family lipoprotein [Candidatus Binatus sp.]|jgi:hypothetical protein|uniref:CC0125/CC1285 family lipoprotein n=1 Tax=Candidatus Binatus sp. TaxID=2811406 RepID=UPI003C6EC352
MWLFRRDDVYVAHQRFGAFAAALAISALSSCATPYQAKGFRGGYSDIRIDSNTSMVSYRANAYTDRQTVQSYLLYRCAQVTVGDGYDYFVLTSGDTEARHGAISTPSTYSSTTTASAFASGNSAFGNAQTFGTVNPGQTITYTKYVASAVIRMFKGKRPPDDPLAYDAHEVIQYMRPNIEGAESENK